MGLDMYLYAERHVSEYDIEHNGKEIVRLDNIDYDKIVNSANMETLPSGSYGGVTVTKCVGYWRKANAIHGWIVRNCANNVDTCQRIDLEREDLIALRDSCLKELANRDSALPDDDSTRTIHLKGDSSNAEQVVKEMLETFKQETDRAINNIAVLDNPMDLTPVEGFFFGSTSKDEYYYSSIEYTVELINSILANTNDEYSFYYRASW